MDLLLILLLGLSLLLYIPLNRQTPKYRFKIHFDEKIPLIPWTVWIYLSYYLVLPLSIILLWRSNLLVIFLIAQIVATVFASAVWKIFPNGVYRPKLSSVHNLELRLLSLIFRHDRDSNGLPSGHVMHSFISCYFLALLLPHLWTVFFLILLLISLSTLTTKQHYFLDFAATPVITIVIIETIKLLV